MSVLAKDAIRRIANGSDFYFRFKAIDIIKNGCLIEKLTDENCDDSTSVFKKDRFSCGIFTKLDFAEDAMESLQELGIFEGMDSGFDLFLVEPWRWIANNGPIHAIAYDLHAGGLSKIVITAGDEQNAFVVQIYTEDGTIVQLADPMAAHVK